MIYGSLVSEFSWVPIIRFLFKILYLRVFSFPIKRNVLLLRLKIHSFNRIKYTLLKFQLSLSLIVLGYSNSLLKSSYTTNVFHQLRCEQLGRIYPKRDRPPLWSWNSRFRFEAFISVIVKIFFIRLQSIAHSW